jgi:hypothetical protein|tara:strand:- start:333 stop:887 length:555 start_codon:yes stop_codon:yes gene_type:complete
MANTTFTGPVRSENGFQSIVKNATTGVITPNYLNVKFDFVGMTHAAVSAGAGVALPANQVSTVNFTGAGACSMVLPAATPGTRVAYVQRVDTTGGTSTLTFDALTTDAWVTGSLIETRAADNVSYDTSTAGEGQLVFTAANATTNFFTIGCILYFSCTEAGLWHVGLDSSKDPLAVKGAFAWAA